MSIKISSFNHLLTDYNCDLNRLDIPVNSFADISQFCETICTSGGDQTEHTGGDQTEQTGGDQTEQTNYCQICLVHFCTPDKGQIHRDEYSRIFQCCNCKKIMGNRQKLKAHHRTHTREKPFHCNLCEQIFSECTTLRKHLLTHGPRKYECQYCNQKFVRKDYLNKHRKSNVCLRSIE